MSKLELNSLSNSIMTQKQLIDSLTSHISLYHSHSHSLPSSSYPIHSSNNQRSSILKWFSSLSVHHRQAHLTAVDRNFVQTLICMLGTLHNRGHGLFIILPDLPSVDNLPSVCFKKSIGLLSRVSDSNRAQRRIFEATMLFASREGERTDECSCSVKNIDTITVSEDFVENLDVFLEFMDGVSNGRFLRGDESELGSDWVELEWLKAKGYYSIEAFVANRLEVAMRLAWLNCNSGKKRGIKLKEKASAAGVAANVYWRKKGCVSWWENLDATTKRKIFISVLGKAAKPLTSEILKGTSGALEDEIWLFNTGVQRRSNSRYSHTVSKRKTVSALANDYEFGSNMIPASVSGRPASLTSAFNSLLVLQEIVMMLSLFLNSELDEERIFFSTLSSICTISDFVLRKVCGFLMVISLDYTKLELISEEKDKSLCNKSKGNVSAYSRKKKGRNRNSKRINAVTESCMNGLPHDKSIENLDLKMANGEKVTVVESKKLPDDPPKKHNCRESSSSKEHAHRLIEGKSLTAARKNRKGKGKNKNSGSKDPVEDINCGISGMEASSSSVISQSEASQPKVVSNDIIPCNISNDNLADKEIFVLKLTPCRTSEPTHKNDASQNIQEKFKIDSSASFTHKIQDRYHQFSNCMVENQTKSCLETLDCKDNQNMTPSTFPDCNDLKNRDRVLEKSASASQPDWKSASPEVRSFAFKQECVLAPEKESGISSSSECLPSEWPSMATTYFSPVNSHLPAATDRLHLDVGRNWHNHFHQSFLPTMHHASNSPADGNPIMSRRFPMSLDWPPMVRGACGLVPPGTSSYDPGLISSRQCTFAQGISPCSLQFHATVDDERRYSRDFTDLPDLSSANELADECDSHWISEDELEVHAVSGIDYNQYFGDGVMYWNPSDHPGTGFSRPPSLSSDDSSWAWREADMIRAVDDMVTFSSSYSTNGLTSPTASFCSPFDPIGPSQSLGYAIPGNDVPGKLLRSPSTMQDAAMEEETTVAMADLMIDVEGKSGDLLPYPILRPIIIPNMSRDRSRSEFKGSHDHKSPCVPPSRHEQPRVKRSPSPVVLCVPRAPRPPPPPPSPASDFRKQRGFPTVRSGSSSPRHWGMRGWFPDGANVEEACLRVDGAEVVWPSWRSNNLSACSMIQPLPAPLLQDRLIAMSQLARDQDHPDVALPLQPPELQNCLTRKTSLSLMHTFLHEEIDSFCKQVSTENLARKPYITWAVKRVRRSLQVLWPRSRTNIFGSNATGLSLPTSDVDLVVCLPPVRNLEPIREAGILEGRNGIKETCLQHAARYLVNQDWVKNDSLKAVENTAIPIIMLVVEVPCDLIASLACNTSPKEEPPHIYGEQNSNVQSDPAVLEESALSKCSQTNIDIARDTVPVRLDISFKSPSHTGLQTTELVKDLTEQFPAATPLALVLKQFLADRSLDQSYSGGLSSYCLILLIIRFLQHEHHLGRPINQNFGSLLMDFLYFFGNVFDPRQMRISVQGSGVYIKRERGCSIDPIHIDDPLYPTNNVGRNCFRIHQCIKAFSEAYSTLENELASLSNDVESCSKPSYVLLPKIIPSVGLS